MSFRLSVFCFWQAVIVETRKDFPSCHKLESAALKQISHTVAIDEVELDEAVLIQNVIDVASLAAHFNYDAEILIIFWLKSSDFGSQQRW